MRNHRSIRSLGALAAIALGMVAAAAGSAARAQSPGQKISPKVLEQVDKSGRAVVVIQLTAPEVDAKTILKEGGRPYDDIEKSVASAVKAAGVATRYGFQIAPFLVADADLAGLKALADHPLVERIDADVPIQGQLAQSAAVIGADQVIDNLGFDGTGVSIALLDTGVESNNALLAGSVLAQQRFLLQGSETGPNAEDDNGHGTAVAGVLTASGSLRGIAPGSGLVAVKVLDSRNTGYMSDVARGVEWVGLQQASIPGLSLINISAGDPIGSDVCPCDAQPGYALISSVVKTVTASGMMVVAAAGNGGYSNRIASPACLSNVLSVGATYDAPFAPAPAIGLYSQQPGQTGYGFAACSDPNALVDNVACFTNRGACLDLVAPGYAITTAQLGTPIGGVAWGTSFAAPHVTGTLALMRQKAGGRFNNGLLAFNLENTADPIIEPLTNRIFYRVNALNAVNATQGPPAPVFVMHSPGDVIIGDLEDGASRNKFVFPDAFDLRFLVEYGATPPSAFVWSFNAPDTLTYFINGVSTLVSTENPLNPPAGKRISSVDADAGNAGQDGSPFTVTFRNNNYSKLGLNPPYPNPPGNVPGIQAGQTQMLALHASTLTTYTSEAIMVYTTNNEADALSSTLFFVDQRDFLNQPSDRNGWAGGIIGGTGAVGTASGLCMSVPLTGDNILGWISPEGYVPLVDGEVYRIRTTADGSQYNPNAIPLWNVIYNNYYTTAPSQGNNYSGECWWLDVESGANAVGRGRTSYEVWATPNSVLTDQWRGIVDPADGAFTPSADAFNDIRLTYRILDLGSGGINADIDAGTICVQRLLIQRGAISALALAPEWTPPINSATHAPQALGQAALGSLALINDPGASVYYQLNTAGPGSRKTLLPYDPSQDGSQNYYAQLYPLAWVADTVFLGKAKIESSVVGGVEGSDPIDAIMMGFDTTTSELGQMHVTTQASPGNMYHAASPRLAITTGGVPQTYAAFFYSHSVTLSAQPNAVLFRMMLDLFNIQSIGGANNGRDPLTVDSFEVYRVVSSGLQ